MRKGLAKGERRVKDVALKLSLKMMAALGKGGGEAAGHAVQEEAVACTGHIGGRDYTPTTGCRREEDEMSMSRGPDEGRRDELQRFMTDTSPKQMQDEDETLLLMIWFIIFVL